MYVMALLIASTVRQKRITLQREQTRSKAFPLKQMASSNFSHTQNYSSLSNKSAAQFINFLENSNLHTLIPSCTFINFRNVWLKTYIFSNEKRKSPTCMPLFHPVCLLIFENLPSCTFIPSYMII